MTAQIAFSPPVEKLAQVRADLFAAMKPNSKAPKGELAKVIAKCVEAGVPATDDSLVEAKRRQGENDEVLRLEEEREQQRKIASLALGDAGTGAGKDLPEEEEEVEPPPPWLVEVSDDEDDEVVTPWTEEIFELRLGELDVGGNGRQIEQKTLEMILCKPVHVLERDDKAGSLGRSKKDPIMIPGKVGKNGKVGQAKPSKEEPLGFQRCRCTSRSVRKKKFCCGCVRTDCCCGDCCGNCVRTDLRPIPKVKIVGVDIATEGGQRFIALLNQIKVDQDRSNCQKYLRLGACRCLSCGCVGKRKALGVDIIEVRFNLADQSRRKFWGEAGWGPEMKRAVASVKAHEGKGKKKVNGGKGIKITRSALDPVLYMDETLRNLSVEHKEADSAIKAMMLVLPGSGVTELRLRRNNLTDRGLRYISKGLHNTILSELHLPHNLIGDHGCMALAAALPGSRVWKVDLTCNHIGDDGALALAAVLWRGTSQVRELVLYDNPLITKVGLSALESACAHRRLIRTQQMLERDSRLMEAVEPLVVTDGETTVSLGEEPPPILDAVNGDAKVSKGLYVAVAYASTPRHVDGRPVAGSRTLHGQRVVEGAYGLKAKAWDAQYSSSGV